MSLCAILEAIGIGIVIPFLSVLIDENFGNKYPFINNLFNSININDKSDIVMIFLYFYISIYFIKTIFVVFTNWIQFNFLAKLELHLSTNLFNKYMASPYIYFFSINSSEIMRNFNAISQHVGSFVSSFLILLAEVFIVITISTLILYNAFQGGIILIIFFAFCIFFYQFLTKNKLKSWGETLISLTKKNIQNFQESIFGIKVIKIFGREKYFINRFKFLKFNENYIKRNVNFFSALPKVWLELISVIGLSIIIMFLLSKNSEISHILSIIAMFVIAAFRIMPSANRMLNAIQGIRHSTEVTKIVLEVFNTEIPNPLQGTNKLIKFKNTIQLKNIFFKYPKTKDFVIKNLQLQIKKGACIGFVGKSGAGKSTFIDILIGLLPISSGSIIVDDNIIDPSSNSWQKLIGYVSQSIYLIDDSIKKNIAFGQDNDDINDESISYALKAAQLDDFIKYLPDGVNTFVGEGGVKLSGGQRQRIALARALYVNPSILIFDEATSSLDSSTEFEVMNAINKLQGKKTILMIAHRLSTLKNCDEIFELTNGKLIRT